MVSVGELWMTVINGSRTLMRLWLLYCCWSKLFSVLWQPLLPQASRSYQHRGDLHGGKKTGKERFVFVFGLIFLKESPTNRTTFRPYDPWLCFECKPRGGEVGWLCFPKSLPPTVLSLLESCSLIIPWRASGYFWLLSVMKQSIESTSI